MRLADGPAPGLLPTSETSRSTRSEPARRRRARRSARARSAPRRRSDARGPRRRAPRGWGLLPEQAAEDVYGVLLELVECRGGGGGRARGRAGFAGRPAPGLGTPPRGCARRGVGARGEEGRHRGGGVVALRLLELRDEVLGASKDFTPSPEAVRARLGGGAPAGASARAATVATAAGTAAGSGPRFRRGRRPARRRARTAPPWTSDAA